MDHIYAASTPLAAGADVEITPPPGIVHLLDHKFAHPSSQSPQLAAASSSKDTPAGRPIRSAANREQDQSPKTRQTVVKQQDSSPKPRKQSAKEEQQIKVNRTGKSDLGVNSKSSVDQHVQPSKAKEAVVASQHKPLEQDHALDTENMADHSSGSKKVAGKDHAPESEKETKKDDIPESKKMATEDHSVGSKEVAQRGRPPNTKNMAKEGHTPESKEVTKEDHTLKSKEMPRRGRPPKSKKMAEEDHTPESKKIGGEDTPEAKNVNGKQDYNLEMKRVARQKVDTPETAIVSGKPDVTKMKSVTGKQDVTPEAKKVTVKRVDSLEKRVSGKRDNTDLRKVTGKEESRNLSGQPDKITESINVTGKQDNNSDIKKVAQDHVSQTNNGNGKKDRTSELKKAEGKQDNPETKKTTAKQVNIVQEVPAETKPCSAGRELRVIGKSDNKQPKSPERNQGEHNKDHQGRVEENQQKETKVEVAKQPVTPETTESACTEVKQSAAEERLAPRKTRKQSDSNSASDNSSTRDDDLFDGNVTRLEKPESTNEKQTLCKTLMKQPRICEPRSEDKDVAVCDLEQQECIERTKSHLSASEVDSLKEQQNTCNTDGKHDTDKEADTSHEVRDKMVAVSSCDRPKDNTPTMTQDIQDQEPNQPDPKDGSLVSKNDDLNKPAADLLPEYGVSSDASNPVSQDHQHDKTSDPVDGAFSNDTSCTTSENNETYSRQNSELDKMSENTSEAQTKSIDTESMDWSETEKNQTEGTNVGENLGGSPSLLHAESEKLLVNPSPVPETKTSDNTSQHAEKLATASCEKQADLDDKALKNLCDAIQLKKKVPDSPASGKEGGLKVKIIVNPQRKRTAEEAGLDKSQSPSVDVASSQAASSSGSSTSIASSGGSTSKVMKPPRVAKAGPGDLPLDIEEYLLPMKKYGWRREMVVRGVYDDVKRNYPPADIYYFPPNGRKLRSGVQMSTYLSENPSVPLKPSNFTFLKKSICEEPWEIIRDAGRGGRSAKSEKSGVSPPKKKPKIIFTKRPAISLPPARSESSTPRVIKPISKSSFISLDLTGTESETDDDDFDPWNEEKSPNWNRKRRSKTFSKEPRPPPETEVLIQSIPEPEIVIDRADESLFSLNTAGTVGGDVGPPPKAPRMVLLPEDIKEECDDSDGKRGSTNKSDVGTVHIYQSPDNTVRPRTKPTARKSTTPRIALKKPRSNKSFMKKDALPEEMGQLCSTACPGMAGVDPTLQCSVCMCLFHHQCVGMNPALILLGSFKCCRCKDVTSTQANPTWMFQPKTTTTQSGSAAPQKHKVFYLRTSLPSPVLPGQAFPAARLMSSTSLLSGMPALPVSTSMDSMQVLRNFTPMPNAGPPLIVRPASVALPHLVRGGTPTSTLNPLTYYIPPLQTRPLPRLKAAPGVMASSSSQPQVAKTVTLLSHPSTSLPLLSTAGGNPPQAQMMTLPASLLSRLNLSQPLAVKLNNSQVVVPPSCLTVSQDGLKSSLSSVKVLLPPSTFPVPPNSNTKMSVTLSNTVLATTTTTTTSLASNTPTTATITGSSATSSSVSPSISAIPALPISPILPLAASCIPPLATSSTPSSTSCIVSPAITSILSSASNIHSTVPTSIPSTVTSVDKSTRQGSPVTVSSSSTIASSSADACASPVENGSPVRITSPAADSDLEIVSSDKSDSSTSVSLSDSPGTSSVVVALPGAPSSDKTVSEKQREEEGTANTNRCRRRINPAKCLIHRLHGGFDCMLSIFQYLTIPDMIRAGQVCRTWQKIFHERCLWQTVSLKGLIITDWEKAASFLSSVRTRTLMLHQVQPESGVHGERMKFWDQMRASLVTLTTLTQLEFGLVPSYVLHSVAESLAGLRVLRAEHISDFWDEKMRMTETKLDIGIFGGLSELRVLHLRGVSRLALPSFSFSGSLSNLANLKHLRSLSLTSLCALRDSEFSFLSDMKQLQMLELGDCLNWTEQTYALVGELSNLYHLRLECGGKIPDCGLTDAISKLTKLERLELIMFTIPSTLRTALSQLPLLHTLIVWPRAHHAAHPALVNTQAVKAVLTAQTLKRLHWGVVKTQPPHDDDRAAPVPSQDHILMLHPKAVQDPDGSLNDQDVVSVSFSQFTEILSSSLPTTHIKVVNTDIVGDTENRSTLWS